MQNTYCNRDEEVTYLVKGPKPKKGQILSSGGIRKNGKMQEMFRDPVPYVEPDPATSLMQKRYQEAKQEIMLKIIDLAWVEFIKPVACAGLQKLRNITTKRLCNTPNVAPQIPVQYRQEIIDVEPEDVRPAKRDNIIPFPEKCVG